MKLKSTLFVFLIAALIGCFATMIAAYDISSYNDAGTSGSYFQQVGFTAADGEAIFRFVLAQPLAVTSNIALQASLPNFLTTGPIQDAICKLVVMGIDGVQKIIPGLAVTPLWQATAGNFIQCQLTATPEQLASLILSPSDSIQLSYSGVQQAESGAAFLPTCTASISSILTWPEITKPTDLFLAPFTYAKNLFSLDTRACCSEVFLQLFDGQAALDRGFPDICNLGSVAQNSCTSNCPNSSVRLTSVNVVAANHIAAQQTDLAVSFRTATRLAAITPTPAGTVTANGEDIPGYVWVRLPKHRATLQNIPQLNSAGGNLNATALGINCNLSHTFQNVVSTHLPTHYTASPQTLVRPIDSSDQSQGVIVQCALGMDVPAGSYVTADITGLYSPSIDSSCNRFGLTSRSAQCCIGYNVEYRYGNALGSETNAVSLGADQCPNFFTTTAALVTAESRIISNLAFHPSTNVTVDSVVDMPWYSFYVSELPTGFSSAAPTYHFQLPGFDIDGLEQLSLNADNYFILDQAEFSVQTATSVHHPTGAYAKRLLNGVLEIKLTGLKLNPLQNVNVFFPALHTTSALPTTASCRGSSAGVPSQDDTCCSGFKLEIKLGGVSTFSYAKECPVIQVAASIGTTTIESCNDSSTFSITGCCARNFFNQNKRFFNDAAFEKCSEYRCSDSTSDLFDVELCCSNQKYRANGRCCVGAYFCPQHCCGNLIPAFNDPVSGETVPESIGFFNSAKCCEVRPDVIEAGETATSDSDYIYTFEGSDLHKICTCYDHMDERDWTAFSDDQCCDVDKAYVQPGGIAALPEVCSCQRLYDALAPVTSVTPPADEETTPVEGETTPVEGETTTTTPLTNYEQNLIIREWLLQYPHLTVKYCCAYLDEVGQSFTDAMNLEKWCDCESSPAVGYDQTCCQFDAFVDRCPQTNIVPDPTLPNTPCTCPVCPMNSCATTCEAKGCTSRTKQTVEITDLTSGGDTMITIGQGSSGSPQASTDAVNSGIQDMIDQLQALNPLQL